MVVDFDKRFLLDVKQIKDKEIRKRIKGIILQIERTENISEITSLKKLEKYNNLIGLNSFTKS